MTVVSWITALVLTKGAWRSYSNMHNEEQQQRIQFKEEKKVLDEAKLVNTEIHSHMSEMLYARRLMEHESHAAIALNAAGADIPQLTKHEIVTKWLDNRQGKLEGKIATLKKRISEESRNNVIDKYVPTRLPHT